MAGLGAFPPPSAEIEGTASGKQGQPKQGQPSAETDAPLPSDADVKTVVDLAVVSPAQPSSSRAPVSHPTVHGIPALSEPALPPPPPLRPSSVPTLAEAGSMALTPSYAPRSISPSASPSARIGSRPPPPLRKRPTIPHYGNAPQDNAAAEHRNGEHPSINVPAPGAQAPKAVTQAPPWTEDWPNLAPAIPKSSPALLSPMRPLADSIEEITGAVLLPPDEGSASAALDEPKVEELSASHIIPEAPDEEAAAAVDTEAVTIAAKPSPLLPAGPAGGTDSEAPEEGFPAAPPPSPSLRIVHDLTEIWNQPQKRWMLALAAAGTLILSLGMLGLIVRLFSGSKAEMARGATHVDLPPPGVVPSTPPSSAQGAPTLPDAASGGEPVTASASSAPCAIAGAAHVIAPKAQIRIGVEALATQTHLALGFVTADKDGFAVALESPSLVALGTAKQHAHESIRHVMPLAGPGKTLSVVADIERKTDKIAGARTVGGNGSFVLGSADGKLVWGTHASDTPHPLWPLESDGPADALRAVALEGGGYAVAFRQGAAIYLGALHADKTPSGDLVRVAGLGPQIGSPALGASGKTIAMAWADRASTTDSWGVRLLEWKGGEAPGEVRSFSIPPGGMGEQAMSPGLAGLGGGRFLLAWTEGPVASHQVRAETLGVKGEVLGSALTISADGVNAGQGQIAVLPDGRGLVVYMASPAGSTAEVVATPIACPPGPM
jgi:hypothetical protein